MIYCSRGRSATLLVEIVGVEVADDAGQVGAQGEVISSSSVGGFDRLSPHPREPLMID